MCGRALPPSAQQTASQGFLPGRRYILDGATGTELGRRGVDIGLPLWSANALLDSTGRRLLSELHSEYVEAGAEIVTANTFRCHRRTLEKAGLGDRAEELADVAVSIAGEAAMGRALVAGSIAPLEDCYRPDLVPPDDDLRQEHSELAQHLAAAGCDLLLVETMNTIREAVAAASAAVATGLPTLVSFVCSSESRLLSGEEHAAAAAAVIPLGPSAVGVNCTPAPQMAACLRHLPDSPPRIAYANIGAARPDGSWRTTDAVDPATYAAYAAAWEASIVGGCCGTTPEHIRHLVTRLA